MTLIPRRQALVVENLTNRVDELTVRSPVNGMVANLAQTEKARVPESAPLQLVRLMSKTDTVPRIAPKPLLSTRSE